MQRGRLIPVCWATNSNLEFVGFVVVIVQGFEHVAVAGDTQVSWVGDTLGKGLAGVLFNLEWKLAHSSMEQVNREANYIDKQRTWM